MDIEELQKKYKGTGVTAISAMMALENAKGPKVDKMNLDEIREYWEEAKTQESAVMPEQIRYLLSVMELAEKALEEIRDLGYNDLYRSNEIAEETLQIIRENRRNL